MDKKNKIILNFFGQGCDIVTDAITQELMNKLYDASNTEQQPLSHCFYDLDFFNKYNIEDNFKTYKSWRDFHSQGKYKGADLLSLGQMEIWKNRKKLKTIKFTEIINSNSLFPILNFCYSQMPCVSEDNQLLLVGLQYKGLVAKYEFICDSFDLDKLELSVVEINLVNYNFLVVNRITYNGVELISRKNDVVQVSSVFSLKN